MTTLNVSARTSEGHSRTWLLTGRIAAIVEQIVCCQSEIDAMVSGKVELNLGAGELVRLRLQQDMPRRAIEEIDNGRN